MPLVLWGARVGAQALPGAAAAGTQVEATQEQRFMWALVLPVGWPGHAAVCVGHCPRALQQEGVCTSGTYAVTAAAGRRNNLKKQTRQKSLTSVLGDKLKKAFNNPQCH